MKVRIQIITFQGTLIWFEFCMFKNKLLDTTALKRNILGRLPSVPSTHIWIVCAMDGLHAKKLKYFFC